VIDRNSILSEGLVVVVRKCFSPLFQASYPTCDFRLGGIARRLFGRQLFPLDSSRTLESRVTVKTRNQQIDDIVPFE
jgi:hypothetical protein